VCEPYKETFPKGTAVRIISKAALENFARDWKYHHRLQPEQMKYAGTTSTVKEVSFYHGGDQLYLLENVPGIWNESCLEAVL
jgi:hypothetical protein